MRYFESPNGQVFGYEPGEQEELIDQAVEAGWSDVTDRFASASLPRELSPEEQTAATLKTYEDALDAHLDAVAKAHRYNSRFTFALRAGYAGPYQAEGVAFAQWMDECNVRAFAMLQRVLAGEQELPTLEGFIAGLPPFVMPGGV